MELILPLLSGAIGAIVGSLLGVRFFQKMAGHPGYTNPAYAVAQIWLENDNKIQVFPRVVPVRDQHALRWYIDAEDDHTVEIEFVSQGAKTSPFPDQHGNPKPRYDRTGGGEVETRNAFPVHGNVDREYWKYQIVWKDPRGAVIDRIDPGVMIKK